MIRHHHQLHNMNFGRINKNITCSSAHKMSELLRGGESFYLFHMPPLPDAKGQRVDFTELSKEHDLSSSSPHVSAMSPKVVNRACSFSPRSATTTSPLDHSKFPRAGVFGTLGTTATRTQPPQGFGGTRSRTFKHRYAIEVAWAMASSWL